MEVSHGKRLSPQVWELSPLDLSIYQYEQKCKNYHYRKKKVPGETEDQRKTRLSELKEARAYLDLEKKRILCLASVESQLDKYRNEFKSESDEEKRLELYESEKHHPTAVLEENLKKVGRAQPSQRFTAHHLVEGKGKLPVTADVRLTLFLNDIRINDPDNGVWMPRDKNDRGHWAMPKATPHSQIHTHNYERWVHGQIEHLQSEKEIRGKLQILRAHLKHGTQPDKVTAKSDKSWNGQ
jgi:A nuclease family of the HNH/ENDO VII superfamily with conserved AHH